MASIANRHNHSDDDEDETAELLRELEKIKKERAEQREQEVWIPPRSWYSLTGAHGVFRSVRRPPKRKRSASMTSP